MSGGHFDYQQYHIEDIACQIEDYVYGHGIPEEEIEFYIEDHYLTDEDIQFVRSNKHTLINKYNFSEETINEFKKGIELLRKAHIYAQRIDWLLSCDDGEEDFHERLKEDLEELNKK